MDTIRAEFMVLRLVQTTPGWASISLSFFVVLNQTTGPRMMAQQKMLTIAAASHLPA